MPIREIARTPSREIVEGANLTAFLRHCDMPDYEALVDWSNKAPEAFNKALIDFIGYRFVTPYSKVMDASAGTPHVKWCLPKSSL